MRTPHANFADFRYITGPYYPKTTTNSGLFVRKEKSPLSPKIILIQYFWREKKRKKNGANFAYFAYLSYFPYFKYRGNGKYHKFHKF